MKKGGVNLFQKGEPRLTVCSAFLYLTCFQRASPFLQDNTFLKCLLSCLSPSTIISTRVAKSGTVIFKYGSLVSWIHLERYINWISQLKDKRSKTERLGMYPQKREKRFHWRQNSYKDWCIWERWACHKLLLHQPGSAQPGFEETVTHQYLVILKSCYYPDVRSY